MILMNRKDRAAFFLPKQHFTHIFVLVFAGRKDRPKCYDTRGGSKTRRTSKAINANANTKRSRAWLSAPAPKATVTSALRAKRFEIELIRTKVNKRGGGIRVRANSVTKAIKD